jgi:hypothetical protein
MATRRASLLLLAAVLALQFLASGIIFGFASLRLILERDWIYASRCKGADIAISAAVVCEDRDNAFGLLYTLATTMLVITSGPAGVLVDRAGPAVSNAVGGFLVVTGFTLVAVSSSSGESYLLPGLMMLGSGGNLSFMSSFTVSFLFPASQSIILTATNCLFDASSVLFLGLDYLHRAGVERTEMFLAYTAILGFLFVLTAMLWTFHRKELQEIKAEGSSPTEIVEEESNIENGEQDLPKGALKEREEREKLRKIEEFKRLSVPKQMKSIHYTLVLVFACTHIFKSNTYLGINKQLLERLGDGDAPGSRHNGHLYTTLFVASLPLSAIAIPIIGRLLDNMPFTSDTVCCCSLWDWRKASTFDLVNTLAIVHSLLTLVPVLEVQLLTFLVFTFYRAFLYSLISTFNARTFGINNVGTVQGSIYTVAAICNLLQYPALIATNDPQMGDGDFTYLNIFFCLLCALLSLLIRRHAQDQLVQNQLDDTPSGSSGGGHGEEQPETSSGEGAVVRYGEAEKELSSKSAVQKKESDVEHAPAVLSLRGA